MSAAQAERDAAQLLQASCGALPPIDPFAIAKSLGIDVQFLTLPPDESGKITIPPRGTPVIQLNAWDHPNRQRFTCAHEIAHYLRRRTSGHVGHTYVDYRDTLAGLGTEPEEIYANQFAAALLMPASAVREHFVAAPTGSMGIESLAKDFETSVQAMQVRLRNLNLV